ncbi:Metal dependent phosphohydrolase [uncultured delta proteobacterium]|uniref:Metal dependent phosphohydrolase n=1 Tax=uncultured delta proteobacterium TaxID=34034 RepID=A0A212KCL3_9DELT|nr:Metal dependent phosphohydrolase [uncultured delta proteobacterium]
MEPATLAPAEMPLHPTENDTAFFDHRFRFTERNNPVVEALYSLAAEWLLRDGYARPQILPDGPPATVAKLDPLDVVQLEVRLPPLPAVMLELQDVLQRRNFSADDVSKVIAKDPGLTAWLLKLVNSPYYGFAAKVSTISRAVALVGTRQIQTLATGGALNSLAVLLPKGLINMELFWRHSVAVGIAAQELWRLSGRSEGEQLFVSGILHDCGQLAMAYAAPTIMTAINKNYNKNPEPAYMAEQALIDFDHARLGGMLLHRWNMPLPLVIAVLRHHQVEEPSRYPEAAAVHIADAMVTALGITTRPVPPIPPISMEAWNVLGLAPSSLQEAAATLRTKLDSICTALRA